MYTNTKWKLKNHGKFQRPSVSEDILNNGGNCVKTSCSANIQILKFFPSPPFMFRVVGCLCPTLVNHGLLLSVCIGHPTFGQLRRHLCVCPPTHIKETLKYIYLHFGNKVV